MKTRFLIAILSAILACFITKDVNNIEDTSVVVYGVLLLSITLLIIFNPFEYHGK